MSAAASRLDPFDAGLTRRRLLVLGGTAVATAAVYAGGLDRLVSAAPAGSPLLRSRFIPHVGERFRLAARGGRSVYARLDEIHDLSRTRGLSAPSSEDGFVLLFHGPRAPRLDQGVLRVRHRQLGTFDLLVSPAGTGRRGQDYAAVINRVQPDH